MDNTLGGTINVGSDASIGMPNQQNNYDFVSGNMMRRSAGQSKVFDNNGGDSKAADAGTVNKNAEYGPVTYGF